MELAKSVLENKCDFVLRYFPEMADVSFEELLTLCDEYKSVHDKETFERLILTGAADPSDEERGVHVDLKKELSGQISQSLLRFKNDMAAFRGALESIKPANIDASNKQCTRNISSS